MHCIGKPSCVFFRVCVLSLILVATVNAQTWIELSPTGGPSRALLRGLAGTGYDAVNNRLILYGSSNPGVSSGLASEVWVLTNANGFGGTPVWIQLTPGGSLPNDINVGHSAVYDAASNRLIVYGGCFFACSPAQSTVYVLTNANGLGGPPLWSVSSVTNPQPRDFHSAVYDSVSNRIIAFGGGLAFYGTDQNDTRVLSNANGIMNPSTWTTLSTAGASPGIREEHRAIYDEANNRMTIFGGDALISSCCPYVESDYNDVWVLSNANGQAGTPTWTQLSPLGSLPDPRFRHSAVYDSANNRMIVFGGLSWHQAVQNYTVLGDLWQLSNSNGLGGVSVWTQLSPTGTSPGPNYAHAAAFDTANQRMIVFGGSDSSFNAHKRVWVLDLAPPSCTPPPAGMVGWWPGDGNANDIIGNNHGALHNGATFAMGVVGQAFSFDGANDYLTVGDIDLPISFSIDAWAYPANVATTQYIVSKDDGGAARSYFFAIEASGTLVGSVRNTTGGFTQYRTSVPVVSGGSWQHLVMTYNGNAPSSGKMAFYVNGVSYPISVIGPYDEGGTPETDALALHVGIFGDAVGAPLNGLLDELELYSRVLTVAEIQALFNAGSAGKCKNQAPVALCQNITVTAGANCTAAASINNGSYDPDGDTITATQSPAGPYPLGTTNVTLTVTDSNGASSQCTATVTVTDNSAPSLMLKPALSLWPPNHKYVTVTTAQMVQSVGDNCATLGLNQVVIEQVTSDEPDNGLGDGDTANDIIILPGCQAVQLRAERAGGGNGRVYSVRLRVQDGAGNSARQEFKVSVPLNQSGNPAIADAPVTTVFCGSGNAVWPTGNAGKPAVAGDFDGDGKSDFALWQGLTGEWLVLGSAHGQLGLASWGTQAAPYNDVLAPGDYDGDGRADQAVFRRADATFYVRGSATGALLIQPLGTGKDQPVPGDYDGDGQADCAVWQPDSGAWLIQFSSGQRLTQHWGAGGAPYLDVPVPGDYDGDGKTDLAVFRRSTGTWYVRRSSDSSALVKAWGMETDVPVAGDYDGDGKTDLAVWRGAAGIWYVLRSLDDKYEANAWGATGAGDVPVPGDYDGDGKTDLAVWRAAESNWYVRQSSDKTTRLQQHGQTGALPVCARPSP